ncbi:AMP-binding protein [bacterium]|nr:AMP-binding protein [bacterium]
MERTLVNLFLASVSRYADNPMMFEKHGDTFEATTYSRAHELVRLTAAGLMSLGLKHGDRVTLFAEGRNDWVFSELGVLFCGAINVPLSIKLKEPSELEFRISHSGSRFVIVSVSQLGKILEIKANLSQVEKVIVLDETDISDPDLISLESLRQRGALYLQEHLEEYTARLESVKESDPANICYTSGTTADPKGIVLTHRNYTANVDQGRAYYHVPEEYRSLLILPWDHSFAHTCGIYTLMKSGAGMAAIEIGKTPIETTKNIGKNIKEIQPHFLLSVPALSDSFKRTIERGIAAKGKAAEGLFKAGLAVAYAYHGDGFRDGRWQGCRLLKPLYSLFDTILFSKIRREFGGRLMFFVGGGALLDIKYQKFFAAIGIPVYQGYGLTEAAPVISANHPGRQKMGTSGPVVPDLEVKIIDDMGNLLPHGERGEIVVRGENVMHSYWKNPEATAKTLQEGWLYTGDMGYLDEDGFLMVLGRFKSLLISNDGEKYSPEGIEESLIGSCPYISQIMLHNNQSPYTTALIVPDKGAVLAKLKEMRLSPHDDAGQKAVIGLFSDALTHYRRDPHVKKTFPGKWIPSTFALLGEEFTEGNRMINSTMKMVRWRISRHYQTRIEFMYTPEGKDPDNARNRTIAGRMG